jgi:hypothetical protein
VSSNSVVKLGFEIAILLIIGAVSVLPALAVAKDTICLLAILMAIM